MAESCSPRRHSRFTWSIGSVTCMMRLPRPKVWAASPEPRLSCSIGPDIPPFSLRHHAYAGALERSHSVQLSWPRPIEIAYVPLFVAAGPDFATFGSTVTAPLNAQAISRATKFATDPERDPDPASWPVLVTGAGGFVGGHVARLLAAAGHLVRGLARRPPQADDGDPPIDWVVGDLRDRDVRRRALAGIRGVIHAASWVSLGPDRDGISQAVNVECTGQLLDEAAAAGVERLFTHPPCIRWPPGTETEPADESMAWNLQIIESAYTRTKRQAEKLVLEANRPGFATIALCPGMVQGPRDTKPTSTAIAKAYLACDNRRSSAGWHPDH